VELLVTDPDGLYVDCTVGGGGHSSKILERLSPQGSLIGIDRDPDAIAAARAKLGDRVEFLQIPFSNLAYELPRLKRTAASGVLMDLGVSSYQLDAPERGFSFRFEGPLDLRMDPQAGQTAAELLAQCDLNELTRILRDYGEDSQARRIAKAIYHAAAREQITTTNQLAHIVREAVPATQHKSLPRVFQALRIAVNTELAELEAGLTGAWEILRPGGRLAVISYHSLEDRRAKLFFSSKLSPSTTFQGPAALAPPEPTAIKITRKPVVPSDREIESNPRARSARLRVIEKL
jgi:16S rRNA (cytosine1402-N4)-methyltransferase